MELKELPIKMPFLLGAAQCAQVASLQMNWIIERFHFQKMLIFRTKNIKLLPTKNESYYIEVKRILDVWD